LCKHFLKNFFADKKYLWNHFRSSTRGIKKVPPHSSTEKDIIKTRFILKLKLHLGELRDKSKSFDFS